MSVRHHVNLLLARHEVVAAPEQRSCTDRTFGLPGRLKQLASEFQAKAGPNRI